MAQGQTDNLLLAVTKDGYVKMGVPPRQLMDDYPARAAVLGKLQNASHVLCSPQGELFCVRNGDLYRGPMPSSKDVDWFSIAQRVGRGEWSYFKILLFNKNGELYGTTNDGKFYKGPQPNQENNPWMYGQATQIGESAWDQFETLFFHPDGDLYGVNKEDKFVKGRPPTSAKNYWDWLKGSTVVGGCDWLRFTHYMAFTTDGKLWAVDKGNGNIYCGYLLADGRYKDTAERLGWNYNMFPFLSFTTDKIISKITSFKFFPQQAKKLSESLQMIQEETFTNTSSAVLKHTFTIDKSEKQISSFTHEHGFTIGLGGKIEFEAGIPFIAKGKTTVEITASTTHNWSFTKANETEVKFSTSSSVELPPGKAIYMWATVKKSQVDMPYEATVETLFGSKLVTKGVWSGVLFYQIDVKQEDAKI